MPSSSLSSHNHVAVLTMTNGENKQNPEFAKSMLTHLEQALNNPAHKALILASDDRKNWSQGIDLEWLGPAMQAQKHAEIRTFMRDMDRVFKTLLLYPLPVIASINGHAFGNGAILACACDFRFMRADRGYFCFPEVDLSIPFLPGQIAFIKKAIPYYRFNELTLTGRRATGTELETDHVVEKAFASQQELENGVFEFASQFDKKRAIFAEHKKRLHTHIIDIIDTENSKHIETLNLMV